MSILTYKDLPDFPHIEKIMNNLWTEREYGKSSIMVGSGFSRNAKKVGSLISTFPLWKDLATKMFDEIYSSSNLLPKDLEKLKFDKTSSSGLIKLASEYECYFGRQSLNSFLIDNIPDDKYEPDELHKLLLELPWSDIFTTNYDTLLERTRISIHDKKYDLVLTTSDIPGKMKPRIVKLHGSFPSQIPFIITEEDYRRYPTDYAPFVNTVQQSMMENVFCLIGFSGNDPNFLAWRGWIRDNLRNNAPIIYLVGLFQISEAEQKLIESNFIKIINLSPIFPYQQWKNNQDQRHYEANKWFLQCLMKGKPPKTINWPKF